MSDYDPSELLLLCESIIEDGELTYDELYQLAEWLNNHQEACSNWPGGLLVAPLQKAWADGKITKTEARQVARIIIEVRKEAANVMQRRLPNGQRRLHPKRLALLI
jgi:hypothetical protein